MFGIGGSSSKTDRQQQLTGYGDLQNIFNYALPQGQSTLSGGQGTTNQGLGELGQAANYNSKILSGNRSAVTEAMAPEINSVTSQANQLKKQQSAMGTSRGGGTNAGNQQLGTQESGQITNLIAQARPQASQALSQIGAQTGGIGLGEMGVGANLLGLGNSAANNLLTGATTAKQEDDQQNNQAGAAAGQLAAMALLAM